MSLYNKKDYAGAWKMTKKSMMRSNTQVPPGFVEALRKEMVDPEN